MLSTPRPASEGTELVAARVPERRRASSFRVSRGFTLVELMIATVAAMSVTIAAFLLSKSASRFFQHEARISTAQLAVSMGMSRLVADIQRASYMSSPNAVPGKDPYICAMGAVWPNGANTLGRMAGITLTKDGSWVSDNAGLAANYLNGFQPDRLSIVGTFGTTEQFPVQAMVLGPSGGYNVYLQPNAPAVWRTRSNTDLSVGPNAADPLAGLAGIFKPGRALRIVDQSGRHEYGIISSFTSNSGQPFITLAPAPAPVAKGPSTTCGFSGFCVGCLVNPVARVQYDIRSFQTAVLPPAYQGYAGLVAAGPSAAVTGDNLRTELVREEFALDTGAASPGTMEIVAEYAVDLKFGLEIVGTVGGPAPGANPGVGGMTRLPITSPDNTTIYTVAADPTLPNSQPERIRTVQVRLSTRTRAPDRESDVQYNPTNNLCQPLLTTANTQCGGPDGRRLRFNVSPSAAFPRTRFARVRTQYADVSLPNQVSIVW
jgi:hypothetical protein